MNERIKQLLNEATSCIKPDLSIKRTVTLNEMQKFADLIVKECIVQVVRECMKLCEHEPNDDEYDQYDMGMSSKAEDIKASIKQHFGVKE